MRDIYLLLIFMLLFSLFMWVGLSKINIHNKVDNPSQDVNLEIFAEKGVKVYKQRGDNGWNVQPYAVVGANPFNDSNIIKKTPKNEIAIIPTGDSFDMVSFIAELYCLDSNKLIFNKDNVQVQGVECE